MVFRKPSIVSPGGFSAPPAFPQERILTLWSSNGIPRKAAANLKKHRIDFHEAVTVLDDTLSTTFPDTDQPSIELRFVTIGMSTRGRVLVVVHAEEGDTVRIISARRATRHERRFCEEG